MTKRKLTPDDLSAFIPVSVPFDENDPWAELQGLEGTEFEKKAVAINNRKEKP